AQALPGDMSRLLGGTGLLDSLGGLPGQIGRGAAAATDQLQQYAQSGVANMPKTARSLSSNWLYWAVPAIAIAGLLIWLAGHQGEQVAQQVPGARQSVVVGGVDIGKQVGDSLGELRTSLASITDVTSAQAALPKLQASTAQLDKLRNLIAQLPADRRKAIS